MELKKLINLDNTILIIEFIQKLKDENGNTIPGSENLIIYNKDIKNIIVTVVNYFRQNASKSLYYNKNEIKDIDGFNRTLEENIQINNKNAIDIFKFIVLFYDKIYDNNNILHYTIKDCSVVQNFVEEYLLNSITNYSILQNVVFELIEQQKYNPQNIFKIVDGFVQGCLSQGKDVKDISNIIYKLIEQQKGSQQNVYQIVDSFVQGCLSKGKDIRNICNVIFNLTKQQDDSENVFQIVNSFVRRCLSQKKDIRDIRNVIYNLTKQQKDSQQNIFQIVDGFVRGCLSQKKDIRNIYNFIYKLIEQQKDNPSNVFRIVDAFVRGCLSLGKNIKNICNTICKLIEQQKDNPSNVFRIVDGFVRGCLLQGKNIQDISNVIYKLIEQQKDSPQNICQIVNGFLWGCILRGKGIQDVCNTIYELTKQQKDSPESVFQIVNSFFWCYLPLVKNIQNISNVIFELIEQQKNNPENVFQIICGFVQYCLFKDKDIFNLESFFIEASKNKNISIDIIYNFIRACVLNERCKLCPENIEHLINIIKSKDNKKANESKSILCGIYVSDYFLKLHNSKKDINVKLPVVPVEFINLLNDVLNRSKDNEIKKIEDLTIKEIKLLFNNLMSIKFNQTQAGVNGDNMKVGLFLQIITSLAENSSVGENTTINKLFNKGEQNKLNEIQQFQDKLDNFSYVEITDNTKINSIEDFVINILNLKSEDFGKDGFKTFYFSFSTHAVTIVIDTSKNYNEFIEDNKNTINDIIMIDSSKAINQMINNGRLRLLNQQTQNFIKKIPSNNNVYQKNGTCYTNVCCTNTTLLNNYKNFKDIVDKAEYVKFKNKNTYILKDEIKHRIIFETSKYFLSNVKEIENKDEYKEVYNNNTMIIKINFNLNNVFQDIITTYKVQKNYLEELEKKLNNLFFKITKLKDLVAFHKNLENTIKILETETEKKLRQQRLDEFKKEISIHYRNMEKLKNEIEKLNNIPKFIVIKNIKETQSITTPNTVPEHQEVEMYNTYKTLKNLENTMDKIFKDICNDKALTPILFNIE